MKTALVVVVSALVACGPAPVTSDVDVIGGQDIAASTYPATVMLGGVSEGCTGTFLGGNTVLTAAHCLPAYAQYQGVKPSTTIVHARAAVGTYGPYDLALVVFGKNVAPATARLATRGAVVGDRVTMVGFGCHNAALENGGKKRMGQNVISGLATAADLFDLFEVSRTGEESANDSALLCSGDSGGPLLNRAGDIVGIASASDFVRKSYHVSVTGTVARTFFAQALGAGVGAIIPGVTPSSSRDAITVDGAQQTILPALTSAMKDVFAKNDSALRARLAMLKQVGSQNVLPVLPLEISGDFDRSNAARLPEDGADLVRGLLNAYTLRFYYPATESVLDSMLGERARALRQSHTGRALAEAYLKEASLNAILIPRATITATGGVNVTLVLLGADGSELILGP